MYEQFMVDYTYRDSASRLVQLFIRLVNFRATSLVSISYIFPSTVVLRTLFLILNICYELTILVVRWECSLNQFSTLLFVTLLVNREPQQISMGENTEYRPNFKSQGKFSSHFASHILGLSV